MLGSGLSNDSSTGESGWAACRPPRFAPHPIAHAIIRPEKVPGETMRDVLMILFVTCSTLGSQLLLKDSVVRIARRTPVLTGLDWLFAVLSSPTLWIAVVIQGIGFLVWLVVVSRVKLGMAFAISGAFFYILMALLSWQLYGERLAPLQWTGIVLVSAGVLMISMLGYKA